MTTQTERDDPASRAAMDDLFLDPITLSFELLRSYRARLERVLTGQDLQPADVSHIMDNIEIDRGVFLSLNRKYLAGRSSWRQFCADQQLAPGLPDLFPKLADQPLFAHQERAIRAILAGRPTILSTGTGSGKTEAFLIPILDHLVHAINRAQIRKNPDAFVRFWFHTLRFRAVEAARA